MLGELGIVDHVGLDSLKSHIFQSLRGAAT
jgi:hypothetical protein